MRRKIRRGIPDRKTFRIIAAILVQDFSRRRKRRRRCWYARVRCRRRDWRHGRLGQRSRIRDQRTDFAVGTLHRYLAHACDDGVVGIFRAAVRRLVPKKKKLVLARRDQDVERAAESGAREPSIEVKFGRGGDARAQRQPALGDFQHRSVTAEAYRRAGACDDLAAREFEQCVETGRGVVCVERVRERRQFCLGDEEIFDVEAAMGLVHVDRRCRRSTREIHRLIRARAHQENEKQAERHAADRLHARKFGAGNGCCPPRAKRIHREA